MTGVWAAAPLGSRALGRGVSELDNAGDVLQRAEDAAQQSAEQTARGGTYLLIDRTTGSVQYVGRTNDLARRAKEHSRDPIKGHLRFKVDWFTDDYAVQRGREQVLYDLDQPPLNRNRPIRPHYPRRQEYLEAARRFEEQRR